MVVIACWTHPSQPQLSNSHPLLSWRHFGRHLPGTLTQVWCFALGKSFHSRSNGECHSAPDQRAIHCATMRTHKTHRASCCTSIKHFQKEDATYPAYQQREGSTNSTKRLSQMHLTGSTSDAFMATQHQVQMTPGHCVQAIPVTTSSLPSQLLQV